jgi:F0F1-type ATP synthase membrane subunit b/b'
MAHEVERIRKETEAHIARIQAHGEHEIRGPDKHAEQSLRAYSARLALELAEQRIRSRMTPETQNMLVDGFVRQMGQQAPAPEVRR